MALIGITTVPTQVSMGNFQKPVIQVNQTYVDLVSAFGAIPVLVTQNPEVVDKLDGLLIIGGQDVDPALWHAKQEVQYQEIPGVGKRYVRPMDYAPNRQRDEFEIALYHQALKKKIPILGICRGLQLINVAEGGTLYQELPDDSKVFHETGTDGWTHSHFIRIDLLSEVGKLMGVEHYAVSSRHHEGIERLGKNLKACGWSEDGLVEIFERIDAEHWVVGVQGHIEQTRTNFPRFDKIVEAFVERAISRQSCLDC